MTPKRIQLSRGKGWRKPEGTIVVSRPSKWGNPFPLEGYRADHPGSTERDLRALAVSDFRRHLQGRSTEIKPSSASYPSSGEIREELAGRDLACWCPLDQPCHGDVLLELANAKPAGQARQAPPRRR